MTSLSGKKTFARHRQVFQIIVLSRENTTPISPAEPDEQEGLPATSTRQSKRLQEKEPSPDDSGEV